jgi:hypothetical protein
VISPIPVKTLFALPLLAWTLAAPPTAAQDFAIETVGFVSIVGDSADGTFVVGGTLAVSENVTMRVGEIELSGGFLGVLPGTVGPSGAGPGDGELVVNGGFEDAEGTFIADTFGMMSLPVGSGVIPGWTTEVSELAWVDNVNAFGAATPFGTHSLDLSGYHDSLPYGGLKQTITTEPGRSYRLSLSLGSNADYPGAGGRKSVLVCVGSAGSVLTLEPTNPTGIQWETFGFGFTATSNSTEIVITAPFAGGVYLGLDNVSVVPDRSEPPAGARDLVVNGSFEDACGFLPDANGVMALLPGSTVLPGWTTLTAELVWGFNGNALGPSSPHGSLFLDLTGYHDLPPYGGISQTLATTPGAAYRLAFALGSHEGIAAYRAPVEVSVTVDSVSRTFVFAPTVEGNQWGSFVFNFTAESAATVLTLQGTAATGGAHLGLDGISVVPVTEIPRAAVLSVGPNELTARFPVEPGHTYTVESREDLATGPWVAVPDTTQDSAGPSFEVSLPFRATEPQRYYRVRQVR